VARDAALRPRQHDFRREHQAPPRHLEAQAAAERRNPRQRLAGRRQVRADVAEAGLDVAATAQLDRTGRFRAGEAAVALPVIGLAQPVDQGIAEVEIDEVANAVDESVQLARHARGATPKAHVEADRPLETQIRIADFEGEIAGVWSEAVELLE